MTGIAAEVQEDIERNLADEKAQYAATQHVMVDVETWGTGPTAYPVSIGAVRWNPNIAFPDNPDKFYIGIDPRNFDKHAFTIDVSTILWWMDPKMERARDYLLTDPKQVDIWSALYGFNEWYGDVSLPTWSNGASFDLPILENAFRQSSNKRKAPWSYQHQRCFRTMKSLVPASSLATIPKDGEQHTALADALWQARALTYIADGHNIRLA